MRWPFPGSSEQYGCGRLQNPPHLEGGRVALTAEPEALLLLLRFTIRPTTLGGSFPHDAGRVEMDVMGEVDRKNPSLCKKPALCLLRALGDAALWPPQVSADLLGA